MDRNREFEGKVVLVTGAGRGIGRACALLFGQLGATVLVNYSSSRERALEVADAIEQAGGSAETVCCDVSDMQACERMTEEIIGRYGKVDVLINNAGITRDDLLLRMTEEEFDRVIAVNLKGTYNTIRCLARHFLRARAGRIVNLSSISGLRGTPGQANYSASKAGVIGLTKSVAHELAGKNITCNAIAPGFIETEMTGAMTENARTAVLGQIPMKRAGKPEEIAEAAAFLASDRASYITGQVLSVDGGM